MFLIMRKDVKSVKLSKGDGLHALQSVANMP
jgi:hypothetical protein